MKKLILAASVVVILSIAGFAHAQSTCDASTPGAVFQPDSVTGGGTYVCPAPTPCGPSKGGDYSCPSGQTCRVDGNTGACVATPVITCGPSKGGDYSCPSGMTCRVDGGVGSCVLTPTATGLCGPSNGGNYSCPSGQTCRVDGNVGTCVATPVATGLCGPSNGGDYSCPSGQTCRVEGNVGACVSLATDSASSGAPSGYVPVITIPGLTDAKSTLVVNQTSLANFLNNLYKYLIGIAAILAVIEIMWGGIMISTQRDSISSHSEGRKKIEHAIGGLVLVLLPALVFSVINKGILDLSVNLPPLDIKAGTYNPNAVGNQVASSTTLNAGSSTFENSTLCNGANCSAAIRTCQSVTGFKTSSFPELKCWNSAKKTMDSTTGGDWTNVVCPAGDQPAVVCTTITDTNY